MPLHSALAKDLLPIYYSTFEPAKTRQDAIREEVGKADFDPVVYAKFKDFQDEFAGKSPQTVVAPSVFNKFNSDYIPLLQFVGVNGTKSKYLILALSDEWKTRKLTEAKVGVVEEVSRENLKEFLSKLISGDVKMVKSVSKPEDLYPLLVFKSVDVILISPENHAALKEKFSTPVVMVGETSSFDLPCVFVHKETSKETREKIVTSFSAATVAQLGFTKVEPIGGGK